jgi:hypothetical protein
MRAIWSARRRTRGLRSLAKVAHDVSALHDEVPDVGRDDGQQAAPSAGPTDTSNVTPKSMLASVLGTHDPVPLARCTMSGDAMTSTNTALVTATHVLRTTLPMPLGTTNPGSRTVETHPGHAEMTRHCSDAGRWKPSALPSVTTM